MRRIEKAAARTFGRHLEAGEEILAVTEAIPHGTGSAMATGGFTGALCAVAYDIVVDTVSPLAAIVLGTFAGIIGGYLVAQWRARQGHGPGATHVLIALTNKRLLTLHHNAAIRVRPLRTIPLADVSAVNSRPTFIGRYRRTDIVLKEGRSMRLLTCGPNDIATAHREQSSGDGVD